MTVSLVTLLTGVKSSSESTSMESFTPNLWRWGYSSEKGIAKIDNTVGYLGVY